MSGKETMNDGLPEDDPNEKVKVEALYNISQAMAGFNVLKDIHRRGEIYKAVEITLHSMAAGGGFEYPEDDELF